MKTAFRKFKTGRIYPICLFFLSLLIISACSQKRGQEKSDNKFNWINDSELNISNLRYHDLRREAASRLAEMGLPINIIARITGHKNINILHNIYAQIDIKEFGKKGYAKYLKEDIS